MVEYRPANERDAQRLSLIAKESKAHWGYPQEWLELWEENLTITEDHIRDHHLLVASDSGDEAIGFIAIFNDDERVDLLHVEHLWVLPSQLGEGIGKALFAQGKRYCQSRAECTEVHVLSDPHAVGFYEAMGFKKIADIESSIKDRTLPLLSMLLD